jgi:hypothetical protein
MNIKSCKGGIYGGRNLWEEFMGGIYGRNLWEECEK